MADGVAAMADGNVPVARTVANARAKALMSFRDKGPLLDVVSLAVGEFSR